MPEELIAASRHLGDDLVPNNPAGNEDAGGHADDNAGGHAGGNAEERSSAGDGKDDGCNARWKSRRGISVPARARLRARLRAGSVPAPRPLLHVREGVRECAGVLPPLSLYFFWLCTIPEENLC